MKTASETGYQFEDIRTFLIKRPWLRIGTWGTGGVVSEEEYQAIKDRSLEIPTDRAMHLRAYIEGWMAAR
jgi:hypothetical protein